MLLQANHHGRSDPSDWESVGTHLFHLVRNNSTAWRVVPVGHVTVGIFVVVQVLVPHGGNYDEHFGRLID